MGKTERQSVQGFTRFLAENDNVSALLNVTAEERRTLGFLSAQAARDLGGNPADRPLAPRRVCLPLKSELIWKENFVSFS